MKPEGIFNMKYYRNAKGYSDEFLNKGLELVASKKYTYNDKNKDLQAIITDELERYKDLLEKGKKDDVVVLINSMA